MIDPDELPNNIRAILEEHTAGGYMMFRINEHGNVSYDFSFDSEIAFLALTSKCRMLMKAIEALGEQQVMDLIANEGEEIDDDSEI